MARSKRTINHEEIKRWAERRGARPSRVKGTGKRGSDPGLLRLNFPDFAESNLEDISWDEFFDKFEANDLSLLYQEEKSNGEVSNFSKLVKRSAKEKKQQQPSTSKMTEERKERRKNSVGSIMTEDVVWCSPKSPLEEAALLMTECDCGEIPVVDDNHKVLGVITDRDITCRSLGIGKNPLKMNVADCMTSPAITIDEDSGIKDCLNLMEENQIRRLVVVDREGICCGMISQADIARHMGRKETGEMLQEISKPSESPSQASFH